MDFDLIVIGAGHNSLITAAYAAQAGYRVAVFERRPIVGGAVSTQEIVPGYQFDLGGSAHILIRLTPIADELGLERFGLDYIELDPLFVSPSVHGESLYIYRDVARTVAHLDERVPGSGAAYRRFIDDWYDFSSRVRDAFLRAPSPLDLGRSFARGEGPLDWEAALPSILRPYGDVANDYFGEYDRLRAMLVWMAAQSGPPPMEPMSAPFLLWHPLYHEGGVARPRGGSGMLTQALRNHIEAHGGQVHVNTPVREILVRDRRVHGVRTDLGLHTARATVSGTHILETVAHLLPEGARPPGAERVRVGNGFGAIVRLALSKPITYANDPSLAARTGLQLICEDVHDIHRAYGSYLSGHPTRRPPLVAMTFSAVDDSLAPDGGEVLWLWGQYFPYELADGRSWDAIASEVEADIIDTFEQYAPGTRDSIVGRLFQHPAWLERELGLFRGNVMHLEMSIDQMFMFRPLLGMAQYRSHLPGLYLTGASTHPGGGIMGASGRNAARVVLRDLDRGV